MTRSAIVALVAVGVCIVVSTRMTFGELYPVGARLSVTYRRFVRGDTINVIFYNRVPE